MKQLIYLALLPVFACPALADEASTKKPVVAVQEHRFEPTDDQRSRVVPIKVYVRDHTKPQPVVLFSHGLGGSRENSVYLGQHWAQAGYVAVFMQHAGSDESVWKDVPPLQRMAAMRKAASLQSSRDRIADVSFVIDQLEKWNSEPAHALSGKMNLKKIGMSGHSFGGRTTAAVMGQKFPFNRQFAEPRLSAFLIFSPAVGKGQSASKAFGEIKSPVLCMTGTDDKSPLDRNMTPESRCDVYEAMPDGDKYQLVFDGGTHMVFSDRKPRRAEKRDPRCHPAIQKISTAFWDAYLKDSAKDKSWLQSVQPVHDAGLTSKDVWQWK